MVDLMVFDLNLNIIHVTAVQFIRICIKNFVLPFVFCDQVVENSSGASRLQSTLASKEGPSIEGITKAITIVGTGNSTSNSSGHTQPREQRNRFEKTSNGGGRKAANDVKQHEESINGTAA